MPVIKLNLTEPEMQAVLKWARGCPIAPLAKHALLERAGYQEGTNSTLSGPSVAADLSVPSQGTTRVLGEFGTTPALSSSQKEKEKRERKKGPDPLEVAERVIGRINELRPEKKGPGFSPKTYQGDIATLLRKGFTESDFCTVIDWLARENEKGGDWGWFVPATIFKPTLFGKKLDNARNGVSFVGGPKRKPPTQKPYTIKASPAPKTDVAPGDLFKHAEIDERKSR